MNTSKIDTRQLPKNIDELQESILQMVQVYRDDEPLWISHCLGFNAAETCLATTLAGVGTLSQRDLHERCLPEASRNTYVQNILRLKKKLQNLGISLTGHHELCISENANAVFQNALKGFHQTNREICQLLGTASLNISAESLPQEKGSLQNILLNILEYNCSDMPESSITAMALSPRQKIVAGIIRAALLRGQDFVFYHHLKHALFPVFVDTDIDIDSTTRGILYKTLKRLKVKGAPKGCGNVAFDISDELRTILIPQGISCRAVTQYFCPVSYAPPQLNGKNHAAIRPLTSPCTEKRALVS